MREQTHKLLLPHQLKRCLKGAAKSFNLKTKLNKKLIRLNKQRKKEKKAALEEGQTYTAEAEKTSRRTTAASDNTNRASHALTASPKSSP